jgi:hypothetical protein
MGGAEDGNEDCALISVRVGPMPFSNRSTRLMVEEEEGEEAQTEFVKK